MATAPKIVMPADMTSSKVKMLVYGPNGVGKTHLVTTAPKAIILAAENSMLTLRKYGVPAVIIDTWETLQNTHDWLKNAKHDFKTVMVDSLNEVQFVNQVHLLEAAGRKRMTIGDWGDNIFDIQRMCRALRDLPMNVIVTASMDIGDIMQPAISTRKLPGDVMNIFDFVGVMIAKEEVVDGKPTTKRAIRFEPSETIRAKRRDELLDAWEKPDFQAMCDRIEQRLKEDN